MAVTRVAVRGGQGPRTGEGGGAPRGTDVVPTWRTRGGHMARHAGGRTDGAPIYPRVDRTAAAKRAAGAHRRLKPARRPWRTAALPRGGGGRRRQPTASGGGASARAMLAAAKWLGGGHGAWRRYRGAAAADGGDRRRAAAKWLGGGVATKRRGRERERGRG
ncbi:hypothetical protein [Oryza sativa Japonica Group]|uniref:Uncharacterized protein n=1 Tax=Oryza sativa subsp. japonica TaxID=39947 RepID=Q5Z8B2_ORYSJ|nr:hypothetical protein [Oryza sativa Japonica Group]BAD53957.1 hypothetical protein [Oryza sativa Japonica Group]